MRVPQAYVCGVEVLLGYCCDKPGELWSRSASPALPSALSAGTIWHAVLAGILRGLCLSVPAALR